MEFMQEKWDVGGLTPDEDPEDPIREADDKARLPPSPFHAQGSLEMPLHLAPPPLPTRSWPCDVLVPRLGLSGRGAGGGAAGALRQTVAAGEVLAAPRNCAPTPVPRGCARSPAA